MCVTPTLSLLTAETDGQGRTVHSQPDPTAAVPGLLREDGSAAQSPSSVVVKIK